MTKQATFSVVAVHHTDVKVRAVATFVNAGDALAYVEWRSQAQPDFSWHVLDEKTNTSIKTIYGMEARMSIPGLTVIEAPAERHITSTALALKLTMILDRSKRIAGESITSGAAAVLNAYTGALRTEFEHLLDDMENGE